MLFFPLRLKCYCSWPQSEPWTWATNVGVQHVKCQATKQDRKCRPLIKKLTETEISVRDKELWFIFYFKTPSSDIPAVSDWRGFIYVLAFTANHISDLCFQIPARVCNSPLERECSKASQQIYNFSVISMSLKRARLLQKDAKTMETNIFEMFMYIL